MNIPSLRMHQTLLFGQDVAKSKDAKRVRSENLEKSVCIALVRVQ